MCFQKRNRIKEIKSTNMEIRKTGNFNYLIFLNSGNNLYRFNLTFKFEIFDYHILLKNFLIH